MSKCRIGNDLWRASAVAGAVLGGLGAGCAAERPWAVESNPPMRLLAGESRQRTVMGPEEAGTVREAAAELAGGAEAWDGRRRLASGEPRWDDVEPALAAAGGRAGIEVVIARTLADGSEGAWEFALVTSDREPGRFRLERSIPRPGDRTAANDVPGAADAAEAAEVPTTDAAAAALPEGWRITAVELGGRPDAAAMRARAARIETAFREELVRLAARPRFVGAPGS